MHQPVRTGEFLTVENDPGTPENGEGDKKRRQRQFHIIAGVKNQLDYSVAGLVRILSLA